MIYVLFGPPGVGKTYVGRLLSEVFDLPFFDADMLIDAEERNLLRSGQYTQNDRDRFIKKLIVKVGYLLGNDKKSANQDWIIAEAFTKHKNRLEFSRTFPNQVVYIRVVAPMSIAKRRAINRLSKMRLFSHVINATALELIWDEFDDSDAMYILNNYKVDDRGIVAQFEKIIS